MPTPIAPPVVTPEVAAIAPPEEIIPLVVAVVSAEKGRMKLTCDVRGLHAHLDRLGIENEGAYVQYASLPSHPRGGDVTIDTSTHKLAARALGRKNYAKDAAGNVRPGILEWDLVKVYGAPPSRPTLDLIAASCKPAALELIAHYQPVEISVRVVTKRGTTTTTIAPAPVAPATEG